MSAQDLIELAKEGDAEGVRRWLTRPGATTPNALDDRGNSALFWAVRHNHHDVARALIDAGASVDLRRLALFAPAPTPLMAASRAGQLSMVDLLLSAGADPDHASSRFEHTPLCLAVLAGREDVVRRLLDAGANVNKTLKMGPLHCAAMTRSLSLMALLIDAGAEVSAKIPTDRTNFPHGGWSALHWSAAEGDLAGVELLLSRGARVHTAENQAEDDPLHVAHPRAVPLLVAAGADLKRRGADGRTPLQRAHSNFKGARFPDICEKWSRRIVGLVAAGDRSWECVPMPCPGLGAAVAAVGLRAPEDLPKLFKRLEMRDQALVRLALQAMHRGELPKEVRWLVLAAVMSEG